MKCSSHYLLDGHSWTLSIVAVDVSVFPLISVSLVANSPAMPMSLTLLASVYTVTTDEPYSAHLITVSSTQVNLTVLFGHTETPSGGTV